MITYNKIVFDIKETLSANKIVDDFNIDDRRIIYLFNIQRNLWLRKEYNTPGRNFSPQIIQSICVNLELKPSNICPCDEVSDCDEFLVSTVSIPTLLELHHKPAITKIGSPDLKNYFFSVVPYAQSVYSGSGRFNSRANFAFLIENKIYIPIKSKSQRLIERINIMGVFEDPTALTDFKNCNGTICFDKDSPYPISSTMLPFIKEMVLKELLLQGPKDSNNDSTNTIEQIQTK